MSQYPPFQVGQSRFDQSTFLGRYRHFLDVLDPFTLVNGEAEVAAAKKTIDQFAKGTEAQKKAMDNKQLWDCQRVLATSSHPDTGAVVPHLLRFSAFAPTNVFICAYMLLPSTVASPVASVAVHWFNQSYNCGINFANRNASSEVSSSDILGTYFAACALSVSIALATTKVMTRLPAGSLKANLVRATLPYVAVCTAGSANVALMRRPEWTTEGVGLTDEEGGKHGNSVAAGRRGIAKCVVTRWAWNVPVMMMPPLLMIPLGRLKLIQTFPKTTELGLILSGLMFGVPTALALFPQREAVDVSALEPRFQNLKTPSGKPVKVLYFNKGL